MEVEETAQDPPTEALAPADEAGQEPFTEEPPQVQAAAGPFFEPPVQATAPAGEAEQGPFTEEPRQVEAAAGPVFEPPTGLVAPAEVEQRPAVEEPPEAVAAAADAHEWPAKEPAAFEEAKLLPETPPETQAVQPAEVETAPVDEVPGVDEKPAAFEEPEPESDNEVCESYSYEEIDRLLGRKRWEQREGPFRGFGSPPGKF